MSFPPLKKVPVFCVSMSLLLIKMNRFIILAAEECQIVVLIHFNVVGMVFILWLGIMVLYRLLYFPLD